MERQRYEYVDLIRGLAALAVLILHFRWFYAVDIDQWPALESVKLPFESLLHPVYAHGNIAVQMFWMLSGFVFSVTYAGRGKSLNAARFAVARFARLYPLHIATLLYLVAIQAASTAIHGAPTVYGNNDTPHFVAQLFLASNWFTHEGSFNGPIWSVSVEVLVYAAFVAYLKIFGSRPPVAAVIALTMIIIERITKAPLAMCGALFFGGVVIARVAERAHSLLGKMMLPAAAAGFLASAVLVWIASLWIGGRAEVLAIYGVLPLALLTFIAMDKTLPPLPKGVHWIGAITYSVYLLHMPLLITVRVIVPELPVAVLAGPYMLPGFVAVVIGLATLSYRYFELPMQRALREWLTPAHRGHAAG